MFNRRALIAYILFIGILCISVSHLNANIEKNDTKVHEQAHLTAGNQPSKFEQFGSGKNAQLISSRARLEDEGRQLLKRGYYEQAIEKYQEALNYTFYKSGYDKNTAFARIRDIHKYQGKYELALEEHEYFMKLAPSFPRNIETKLQIEALIKARDTKSNDPIYEYIKYLRQGHLKDIPPQDTQFNPITVIGDIFWLYDHIGDYNSAIKFVDELLASKSIDQYQRAEYEKVKAAFEEDRRSGTRGHLAKVYETSQYF